MAVPIVGQAMKVTTLGTRPIERYIYVYESDPSKATAIAKKVCPGDEVSAPLPLPQGTIEGLGLKPGEFQFWP